MVKRGFTLVEIVLVLIIISLLSTISLKLFYDLLLKRYQTKEKALLNLKATIALEQLNSLLLARVPGSFKAKNGLYEWLEAQEKEFYDGFVDMLPTIKTSNTLFTTSTSKKGEFGFVFDREVFEVNLKKDKIIFLKKKPKTIYEKYYLTTQALGVALAKDVKCENLKFNPNDLLLFYNYKPWKGEEVCDGKVSLLVEFVKEFNISWQGEVLKIEFLLSKKLNNKEIQLEKSLVVIF